MDDIVVFHPLGKGELKKIVKIQTGRLFQRLQAQNITLEITPEAEEYLAEAGYDPVYGARPLKRVIQKELETPLARNILEGKFKPGDKVTVVRVNGGLSFQ